MNFVQIRIRIDDTENELRASLYTLCWSRKLELKLSFKKKKITANLFEMESNNPKIYCCTICSDVRVVAIPNNGEVLPCYRCDKPMKLCPEVSIYDFSICFTFQEDIFII